MSGVAYKAASKHHTVIDPQLSKLLSWTARQFVQPPEYDPPYGQRLKCFNALQKWYCGFRNVMLQSIGWLRKAPNLSVLLPGLEAASQGAMHEQLGNSQQLLPHLPLMCCLLSPSLECSAHHAKYQHSPAEMPVTLPNTSANTPLNLPDTQSNLNTHNSRAYGLVTRLLQAQIKHPICCNKVSRG